MNTVDPIKALEESFIALSKNMGDAAQKMFTALVNDLFFEQEPEPEWDKFTRDIA